MHNLVGIGNVALRCARRYSSDLQKTLGVIVIGNEILRGVNETNFAYIAKHAPSYGLKLSKVVVIPDIVENICYEVQHFSALFDVVLTSGGIGITHDDLTFEGVALAFNEQLKINSALLEFISKLYNCDVTEFPENDSRLRLARVPESAKVIYGFDSETGKPSVYPVICVKNVFLLPGVPEFFREGFGILKPLIRDTNFRVFDKYFYLKCEESLLAKSLTDFAIRYEDNLLIGSYPINGNSYYKVKVSIESREYSIIQKASSEFETLFGEHIVSYEPDPVSHAASHVYKLSEENSDFGRKLASSIRIIEDCLSSYKIDETILSFNGGKDCTVLLHLIFAVLNRKNRSISEIISDSSYTRRFVHPRLLYVRARTPFPEVETFIQSVLPYYWYPSNSVERHCLVSNQFNCSFSDGISEHGSTNSIESSLIIYEGLIKDSLFKLSTEFPELKAIFLGTRSSDPSGASTTVMMDTDPGWPKFMRIHPILEWNYSDVWRFIRELSLPYCTLYDFGYTSLGSMEDTHPNLDLRIVTSSGLTSYAPAYTLKNNIAERNGRLNIPKKA